MVSICLHENRRVKVNRKNMTYDATKHRHKLVTLYRVLYTIIYAPDCASCYVLRVILYPHKLINSLKCLHTRNIFQTHIIRYTGPCIYLNKNRVAIVQASGIVFFFISVRFTSEETVSNKRITLKGLLHISNNIFNFQKKNRLTFT